LISGPGKVGQGGLKVLMMLLTKNPHPPSKKFFRVQARRFAASFDPGTALYRFQNPSYMRAKPRAIQLFLREPLDLDPL